MRQVDIVFKDRVEAGQILASQLAKYETKEPLVLGLPRGGVPVAFEVAKALKAPLDVYIVRKLGVPGHEELAMGAIATGDVCVLNESVIGYLRISKELIATEIKKEKEELQRRERVYRSGRDALDVANRTVLLIDDGIATGSTIKAAIAALKKQQAAQIIVGVPVAPLSAIEELKQEVDDLVCVLTPDCFIAISLWYDEFPQTTDEQVCELMERAERQKQIGRAVGSLTT